MTESIIAKSTVSKNRRSSSITKYPAPKSTAHANKPTHVSSTVRMRKNTTPAISEAEIIGRMYATFSNSITEVSVSRQNWY